MSYIPDSMIGQFSLHPPIQSAQLPVLPPIQSVLSPRFPLIQTNAAPFDHVTDRPTFGNIPDMFAFKPDVSFHPRLVPLPPDNSENVEPSSSMGLANRTPTVKVAGSRRKRPAKVSKGKGRLVVVKSELPATRRRGRPTGTGNFLDADVCCLLDAVAQERPMGERGWKNITGVYNSYAQRHGHPVQTAKSLENKFKMLVQTPKPTGSAEVPPNVERAWAIEESINEQASTRDVNDSEFEVDADDMASIASNNSDAIEISSDAESLKVVATVKRSAQNGTDPTPHRKQAPSLMYMKKIADNFNPSAQHAREHDRAEQSLSAVQILALNSQLRDSQQTVNNLRSEITQLYSRLHASESNRQRIELKLEFLEADARVRRYPHPKDSHKRHCACCHTCDLDGTTRVIVITDSDSLSSDDEGKENYCHKFTLARSAGPSLTHPRPFPIDTSQTLRSVPLAAVSLNAAPISDLGAVTPLPDTDDLELPSPSVAFKANPADATA